MEIANHSFEYERTSHAISAIAQDEDCRKLRVRVLLLEDEIDHIAQQLGNEQQRCDNLQQDLDEANNQLEDFDAFRQQTENSVRTKARQLDSLRVCGYRLTFTVLWLTRCI